MNMQRTSGLAWIRGSKEALSHAPGEVRDTAEAGSAAAACGRGPRRHALLWIAAALFVTPTLAFADLLTATITNEQENVLEGTSAEFTVKLTGGVPTQNVVIEFTVSGSAEPETGDNDGDYQVPAGQDGVTVTCDPESNTCSGRLTIGTGATTGTFTINAIRDLNGTDVLEGDESLTVTLTDISTDAGTVRLGTPAEATTTIIDNGTVTLKVDDVATSVTEGTEAIFMVSLSGEVAEDVTIGYATGDGTATAGVDYTPADADAALVIEAGDETGMITVETLDDRFEEDDETVTVTLLGSDLPANVRLGRDTATATIADNEELMMSVEVPANTAEGSPAIFTIKLTGGTSSADVAVAYSVSGVTPEVDYEVPRGATVDGTEVTGIVTIPAGVETGTITIQTIGDDDPDDPTETLTLTLSDPVTEKGVVALAGDPESAATVIKPSNTVTVSIADTTVLEGNRATFTVTLSDPVANATTVKYVTGTTTSEITNLSDAIATDFEAVADADEETLTIPAGRTSGSITIETEEDNLAENSETFTVMLSEPEQNTNVQELELGRTTATATITDDDPLTVSVASNQITAIEAGQMATFTVSLSGGVGNAPVMVRFTASGTTTAGEDYEADPNEVTLIDGGYSDDLEFGATVQQVTIAIPTIANDQILEVAETLTVTLTHVTTTDGTVALGTANQATATIGPSNRGVTVTISPPEDAVEEGDPAVFEVELLGPVATDVVVGYTTVPGAASTADYTAQSSGRPDHRRL